MTSLAPACRWPFRRGGASRLYPSSDADEFGLPELAHSVERFDRNGNLGRASGVVA